MARRKFHQWRIGTINFRTGKDDEKIERTVHEIHKAGLSICGLQEVRRLNKGSALISNNIDDGTEYKIYWSGHSLKRIHGVGIVIKVDKNIELVQIVNVSARIIAADVIDHGCSLRVINCYASTENDTNHSKESFYRSLR
jgi:exonuclease III